VNNVHLDKDREAGEPPDGPAGGARLVDSGRRVQRVLLVQQDDGCKVGDGGEWRGAVGARARVSAHVPLRSAQRLARWISVETYATAVRRPSDRACRASGAVKSSCSASDSIARARVGSRSDARALRRHDDERDRDGLKLKTVMHGERDEVSCRLTASVADRSR
jgi:hypothetical protein